MYNLILYGSGNRCRILLKLLQDSNIRVSNVIDTNPTKWGEYIGYYKICSPDVLMNADDCYVCVTFYSSLIDEPIWNNLKEDFNISNDRIISFHDMLIYIYAQKNMVRNLMKFSCSWKTLFDGSWELGLGGVESWLKDIVAGLLLDGYKDLYFITKKNQATMPTEIENCIIDFCLCNVPQFSTDYVGKGIDLILQELPCTIVFSRVDELMLAAYLVKKKYPDKIKIIMVDHGSCDGMYRDILSYRKEIDYYMCVSTGIQNELVKRGIEPNQINVMTCPVQYDISLKRTYSLYMNDPIQIGYAGRLEIFEKRIDILIKLILQLEEKKVNYHFNIAGEGTQYSTLDTFIQEKNLCGKVSLLGRIARNKMGEFWKKQDIAVNTSDNEGRPLANMEAMINGVVPVVTRTIGILDDVTDGSNGYIVPVDNAEAMAEKISYLEKNRNLLIQFGERAREEMINKSDINKHIKMWKDILSKMELNNEIFVQ